MIYYSKATGGFYDSEIHGERTRTVNSGEKEVSVPNPDCLIPDDAVEIGAEDYASLMAGQSSGKAIATDKKGRPVLVDRPGPNPEQIRAGIIRQIAALEAAQPRMIREATLGYEGAMERLQALDAQIAALRSQLA